MAEMKFGIDVYVCDSCKAIKTKVLWKGGKCPNCGHDSYGNDVKSEII